SSTNVDGAIIDLTDSALPSTGRQVLKNYYSQVGSTGKIDFEAGVTGANNAVTVDANTDVLIGSFYVRVKTNPVSDGTYTLTLRAQNAATEGDDQYRNSVIGDGSSVNTAGKNIMGQATSADLTVKKTTVALSIDPSYTTIGQSLASDRRVGDIIPVDLKLTATTIVRNATSLNAVITFPSADFVLVTSATDAAPVSATTGVGAVINSTGFAFGTGALASAPGAANTFRVASSLPTITLKIDGAALALAANDVKTVGRFYVRPKYNGDTSSATKNLTIAANPSLGIRASDGSLGFTTTVTGAGDFRVAVAKTTVTLSLKVADPADSTRKHRTGDTIQVELQVAASDIARNATSLDATITVPSADYVLVNAPTPSKLLAIAPVVKTTNGVAFGNAFTSKGGSSADGTNNNLSGNTITLKIDGTALNLLSTTP
ncbi:MAG: hypothetical protein EB020_15215, partial [Proteobacteria bacterium]|nr:hypothetical protein [Pseudomonadota bacterium]